MYYRYPSCGCIGKVLIARSSSSIKPVFFLTYPQVVSSWAVCTDAEIIRLSLQRLQETLPEEMKEATSSYTFSTVHARVES